MSGQDWRDRCGGITDAWCGVAAQRQCEIRQQLRGSTAARAPTSTPPPPHPVSHVARFSRQICIYCKQGSITVNNAREALLPSPLWDTCKCPFVSSYRSDDVSALRTTIVILGKLCLSNIFRTIGSLASRRREGRRRWCLLLAQFVPAVPHSVVDKTFSHKSKSAVLPAVIHTSFSHFTDPFLLRVRSPTTSSIIRIYIIIISTSPNSCILLTAVSLLLC